MDSNNRDDWMTNGHGVFIDIHDTLRPYEDVTRFFRKVERDFDRRAYCNGSNTRGRWIYQIYSIEFIRNLSNLIERVYVASHSSGPILEVMAGDGLLGRFVEQFSNHRIISTDAKTSRDNIGFPKSVIRLDALSAVTEYDPSVVVMCWEPFYSDVSLEIVAGRKPVIWIGDPLSCAVSSDIHRMDHIAHHSPYLLGRHDNFTNRTFRTVVKIFNQE